MQKPERITLNHIRDLYEQGASLPYLRRRFNLSRSEAQDIAPEEFEEQPMSEGNAGY